MCGKRNWRSRSTTSLIGAWTQSCRHASVEAFPGFGGGLNRVTFVDTSAIIGWAR
jgi:hypothetical protein